MKQFKVNSKVLVKSGAYYIETKFVKGGLNAELIKIEDSFVGIVTGTRGIKNLGATILKDKEGKIYMFLNTINKNMLKSV